MGPDWRHQHRHDRPRDRNDDLEGITGEGTMLADDEGNHTLSLTYELP